MKTWNEFAAVLVMGGVILSACMIVSQSPPAAGSVELADASIHQAPADEAAPGTRCDACGVVESSRAIDAAAATSHDGYEVVVRMEGGAKRVFRHAPPANWRAGERLILIAGTPSRFGGNDAGN